MKNIFKKFAFAFQLATALPAFCAENSVISEFKAVMDVVQKQRDNSQSVHLLDAFVQNRGSLYLQALEEILPVTCREANPHAVLESQLCAYLDANPETTLRDAEGSVHGGAALKDKLRAAIGWSGGAQNSPYRGANGKFGAVDLFDMTQRLVYYISRLADPYDHVSAAVIQLFLDADRKCLQGQTNRIMEAIQFVYGLGLRPAIAAQRIDEHMAAWCPERVDLLTPTVLSFGDSRKQRWDIRFGSPPDKVDLTGLAAMLEAKTEKYRHIFVLPEQTPDLLKIGTYLEEAVEHIRTLSAGQMWVQNLCVNDLMHYFRAIAAECDASSGAVAAQLLLDIRKLDLPQAAVNIFCFADMYVKGNLFRA